MNKQNSSGCSCGCAGCRHAHSAQPEMSSMKCGLVIVVVFLVILLFILYAPGPWNHNDFEHLKNQSLAKKLSNAGWTFYSREGCGWCTKQFAEFSESDLKDLDVVKCTQGESKCAGISGFPTWKNKKTGEVSSGYKSKEKLMTMV